MDVENLQKVFERIISAPPFERSTEKFPNDPSVCSWPNQYRNHAVQVAWEVAQDMAREVAEDCARMCDKQPDKDRPNQINGNQCDDYITGYGDGSGDCAVAIREKYCGKT